MAKTYKLRVTETPEKGIVGYALAVPHNVGRHLPRGMEFSCELTEDGILFRPAGVTIEEENLPQWTRLAASDAQEDDELEAEEEAAEEAAGAAVAA